MSQLCAGKMFHGATTYSVTSGTDPSTTVTFTRRIQAVTASMSDIILGMQIVVAGTDAVASTHSVQLVQRALRDAVGKVAPYLREDVQDTADGAVFHVNIIRAVDGERVLGDVATQVLSFVFGRSGGSIVFQQTVQTSLDGNLVETEVEAVFEDVKLTGTRKA